MNEQLTEHNTKEFNVLKFKVWNMLDEDSYLGTNKIVNKLIEVGYLNNQADGKKKIKEILKELVREGYATVEVCWDEGKLKGKGYFKKEEINLKEEEVIRKGVIKLKSHLTGELLEFVFSKVDSFGKYQITPFKKACELIGDCLKCKYHACFDIKLGCSPCFNTFIEMKNWIEAEKKIFFYYVLVNECIITRTDDYKNAKKMFYDKVEECMKINETNEIKILKMEGKTEIVTYPTILLFSKKKIQEEE